MKMRNILLTAVAAAALASPAVARDGSAYIGLEGGVMIPRDLNGDAFVDFTTTPATPAGPGDFVFDDAFDAELDLGFDIDAIAGYDFGGFRVEGELGHKRADREGFDPSDEFLAALNAGLNRPSAAPDPGAPGQPALTDEDFEDFDGKVSINSAMLNALADFGNEEGMSFYAGAGFGRAWGRALDDGDSAWAWQLIAGARTALSPNIDFGLKYRYFRTGRMNFEGGPIAFGGNLNRVVTGATVVDQRTDATITPAFNGRFQSHSLLASLIFNFGAAADPLPPPPPPPPPPAPPPQTQTCPDGTVVLVTETCPVPTVPPPPPPPQPQGERG